MSGGAPLPPSQMPLQKVSDVQFQMFKEKQVKDYAVCRIEHAKSFENGEPVRGGINDLRMGSTDFDHSCETCHMPHPDCPGHFGYVELSEPLFNIGVFDIVLIALKCVCKECGALLADLTKSGEMKRLVHLSGINRLRMVAKMSHYKCDKCEAKQPRIGRFEGIYPGMQVRATIEEVDHPWNADIVRQVFDRVLDADAKTMGFDPAFCHPRDLVLTVLPIPPPQVRPAISFGSMKSDDELTHQIMSIVKRNLQLRRDKESDAKAAADRSRALLQESVATLFNNASTYYKPTKVGDTKTLKSLTERLKGKYGRLRGNLMGKRVDFSARTVITGDPNIDVDEVGVPFSVAMTLTFPERVNAINKKRLTEFVHRSTYPSANYVMHPNGTVTKLGLLKDRSTFNLNVGDLVERHVINGDVVLFNRQPTLHRMSMMGHRVRVLNYNTFRLNLSCTTPYNADFDGDEMNLHVPQSLVTKAELMEMMMVPKNFVSPNKSAPCMGIVQDSLLGSYRLTDKDTFLDKYFVQSVTLWINEWKLPIPAILKPRPLWTGKQIFSLVLPEVNHPIVPYVKPPFSHNDKDLFIQRGQLLMGAITKNIVGASPGSLIHVIFNERGSDDVANFINGVQRVTAFFNINFAFSVGVQDTVADPDTLRKMNEVLLRTRGEVEKIGAAANNRTLSRKAGMTLMQSFEADVNTELNKCREEAAKDALGNVKRTNSFKVMIEAGSKGTHLNICQIAVFVGQQNVAGARIPFGFRHRTLPHFMLDDYGEASRGMAMRGYVEGLKPHEFYFHTMAGREGLIDTAVKTSDTGYLQRKLMKALEDVHASYDGTVRTANSELIQLFYGEDGLDGARIEGNQEFNLIALDNKGMESLYKYEYNADGSFSDRMGDLYMDPLVRETLIKDPVNLRKLQGEFDQLLSDRTQARAFLKLESTPKLNLPVNIGRLVQNARSRFVMGRSSSVSDLNPLDIIDKVRDLETYLTRQFPSYHKTADGHFTSIISQHRVERALTLFKIHLRQMLGSKRVLREYKLNTKGFEFLLKEIRTKYQQAIITPGENIGAIAAQSCGEPATQMTLNTFHNAGISSKNVTLGVPRLLELLNVSKNQRNASLSISLIKEWQKRDKAQKAQHFIEYCTLASLTTTVQIIYDPNSNDTVVDEDADILRFEQAVRNSDDDEEESKAGESPFIARLILDSDVFNDKQLNMKDVKGAIRTVDNSYIIQANMENTGKRVVRLRPRVMGLGEDAIPTLLREVPLLLSKVHLLGIPGVKKTLLKDAKAPHINEATGALEIPNVWMIDTEGTALKKVFVGVLDKENNNIIDFSSTSSNKVPEVAHVLGIEAARWSMLNELREAYVAYGLNINYRHYSILVDTMCQRGYLMAVSRSGINRSEMSGPLMRCSFEETVKVLMAAAAFGEKDPIRGVSANLVVGNQARIGTGLFDLMLNTNMLLRAVSQEEAVAPGKVANTYHGPASVLQASSSMASYYKGAEATPLVNEGSTFYRGDGTASSMAPFAGGASTLYGPGLMEASMVHRSVAYPDQHQHQLNFGGGRRPGVDLFASTSHSVQSTMSAFTPDMGSNLASLSHGLASEAYTHIHSFNLQSQEDGGSLDIPSSAHVGAYGGALYGGGVGRGGGGGAVNAGHGLPMPASGAADRNSQSFASASQPHDAAADSVVYDPLSSAHTSAPHRAGSEGQPQPEFSSTEEQEES